MAYSKINPLDVAAVTTSKGTCQVGGRALAIIVRVIDNQDEINELDSVQIVIDSKDANIEAKLKKSL